MGAGPYGGMAEWSNAAVLKTAECKLRGFESLSLRFVLLRQAVPLAWNWPLDDPGMGPFVALWHMTRWPVWLCFNAHRIG